ncbi:ABC transporter permease [Halobacteriales archaeon QS_8_69_26]|nr:MAG: ABC transporter permease [Halobacteriales archaeon QS_8_69_26]
MSSATDVRRAVGDWADTKRRIAGLAVLAAVVLWALVGVVLPSSAVGGAFWWTLGLTADAVRIGTRESTIRAALRLSVPIGFAALGGIFAEKSGVINIGLEGLLIISAFTGVLVTDLLGPGTGWLLVPAIGPLPAIAMPSIWIGFLAAVLASTLLALLFAVVCIEFRADQIIAGLAVWLIALGLAPFASRVVYGTVNSDGVGTLGTWTVPGLSALPVVGPILFQAAPTVLMLLVAVPASWYLLNRTTFGRWVRASGENPKALDTAGVSVHRVRYAGVLLSGVLSGIGGAGLSLGHVGLFIGNGQTMVNGKGFIAITAYLFGNYNPFGAFGASVLFAGLDALQIRLQQLPAYDIPESLVQTIPFVTVIVALVLVGRTRLPAAAGEHYESGEE